MSYRRSYRPKVSLAEVILSGVFYAAIIIGILIILLGILFSFLQPVVRLLPLPGFKYSEGQRTGNVFKFSKKGYRWVTWEGSLSLGLTTANSDGVILNQVFDFSVSDPKLAKELETAASGNKTLTLHYVQYVFRGYKYGSTEYTVTAFELANAPLPPITTEQP